MTTRVLDKSEWRSFCDKVSTGLRAQMAQIDVMGLALGDQKLVGQWVPFLGIVYDHKDDLVEIALDGLDHMIDHPREIAVVEAADGLQSIEITGGDGLRQIVKLQRPAQLAAASA